MGDGHDAAAMSWIRLTSVAILCVVICREERKWKMAVQAQEEGRGYRRVEALVEEDDFSCFVT